MDVTVVSTTVEAVEVAAALVSELEATVEAVVVTCSIVATGALTVSPDWANQVSHTAPRTATRPITTTSHR